MEQAMPSGSLGGAGRTEALERIRQGMVVIDRAGERLGTVEYVQMGDPDAATTQGQEQPTSGIVGEIVRSVVGDEPRVPEPLRSQLLRHGFIKVDGPGLIDSDHYVRGDRIASVVDDTVTLTTTRDQTFTAD